MQGRIMHHTCYGFWCNLTIIIEFNKKNNFLAHSKRFFVLKFYAIWVKTNFYQIKEVMNVCNRGTFHKYNTCGCQVKNLQNLLYQSSIYVVPTFWDFFHTYFRPRDSHISWQRKVAFVLKKFIKAILKMDFPKKKSQFSSSTSNCLIWQIIPQGYTFSLRYKHYQILSRVTSTSVLLCIFFTILNRN